jgi:hypothetical protein
VDETLKLRPKTVQCVYACTYVSVWRVTWMGKLISYLGFLYIRDDNAIPKRNMYVVAFAGQLSFHMCCACSYILNFIGTWVFFRVKDLICLARLVFAKDPKKLPDSKFWLSFLDEKNLRISFNYCLIITAIKFDTYLNLSSTAFLIKLLNLLNLKSAIGYYIYGY